MELPVIMANHPVASVMLWAIIIYIKYLASFSFSLSRWVDWAAKCNVRLMEMKCRPFYWVSEEFSFSNGTDVMMSDEWGMSCIDEDDD